MSASQLPPLGSAWHHGSGRTYVVLHIANVNSDPDRFPLTIVYRDMSGRVYTRRADDWHQSMTLRPSSRAMRTG